MVDFQRYLDLRPSMHTGDLLAVRGDGMLSRLIQWRTHSPYSHVGLIIREEGDWLMLLHATARYGVAELPVSRYLQGLKGTADWMPLDHDRASQTNPNYRKALLAGRRELGRTYDYRGVLSYLLPWVAQQDAARYCSELLVLLFHQAGLLTRADWTFQDFLEGTGLFKPAVSLV